MMKKLLTLALGLVTTISFAQTFVSTTPENRNVVLEEFTGIYCGYCPDGHVIGQGLHDANPNDVFLINVHSGGYATPNGPSDPDFRCPYGDALDAASGLAGYPAGTVNRATFTGIAPQGSPGTTALSRGDWGAASNIIMADPAYVNVAAQASYDMSTGILTVNTEAYYTATASGVANMLHVAIVENNVPGPQSGAQNYNPGAIISGPWTPTYNHQHMFRHLMDGANGLEFNVTTAGTFVPNTHTWTMPANLSGSGISTNGYWPDLDPTNMDVVVYIAEGLGEIVTGSQTSVNCIFPNAYDANVTSSSAMDVVCTNETDIDITFRNYGNQPLTSLDLTYDINGGTPATYNWTGNMASGATETVTITNVTFSPQPDVGGLPGNAVTWTATNPNGQVDQNTTNNSSMSKFSHFDASGLVIQGIDAGTIDVSITTDNYGSETTWEIVDEAGNVLASGGPYGNQQTYNVQAIVPANQCFSFLLYDSFGDGMCCANGVGAVLVTDASGNLIFEGGPVNLQNFTELGEYFSTGAATGDAWSCSPFGCIEVTPGTGNYVSQSVCESDPTTGCYVGPSWDCDPAQGCIDVGTAGLGTYNTEQECIDDASNPCGSVSINENATDAFNLYPNPAQDVLSIDGVFKSIEIYDVFGKLVLASDNKSEINISSLANGSYYINILTQDAVIKRKVTIAK